MLDTVVMSKCLRCCLVTKIEDGCHTNASNLNTCITFQSKVVEGRLFVPIVGYSGMFDTVVASENINKLFLVTEIQDGPT